MRKQRALKATLTVWFEGDHEEVQGKLNLAMAVLAPMVLTNDNDEPIARLVAQWVTEIPETVDEVLALAKGAEL